MIHSIKNQFNSASNFAYGQFQSGIDLGAKISVKLDDVKLLIETTETSLKLIGLISDISKFIPFETIFPFLKDGKRIIGIFLGLRSIKFFMEKPLEKSWKLIALNVAGLSLFCFTIIDVLAGFKVDFSPIHSVFKRVLVFGILPFAGLINLSTITLLGMVFLMTLDKQKRLNQEETKWKQRQNDFSNFKIFTDLKVESYRFKAEQQDKSKKWTAIQGSSKEALKLYFDGRKLRLNSKLQINRLQKTSTRISLLSTSIKISSIVFSTFVIVSGVGFPVLFGTTLTLAVLKCSLGLGNYFLKRRITHLNSNLPKNPILSGLSI